MIDGLAQPAGVLMTLTAGPDPDHPGRWLARVRWDNYKARLHEKLDVVNEPTVDEAIDLALDLWRDKRDLGLEESL